MFSKAFFFKELKTYFVICANSNLSSANAFNLDQSEILSSVKILVIGLTLSILLTTEEAFVDSVNQDQTAQNVQSDLCSILATFPFWIRTVSPSCNGSVFLTNEKM